MKKCVFAGTFDPPTVGHKYVVDCCLKIFDEVVVAIMVNTQKTPYLTVEERKALLGKLYNSENRVRILSFSGAAADLLEAENTPFYVRGVRDCIDFEYENRDFYASKRLKNDLIEIYIPAEQSESHVSSTLVKNSVRFSKDFSGYLPEEILEDFIKITEKKDV